MYRNFTLTESERKQILEQHKNHGYGKPLNEQQTGVGHSGLKYLSDKLSSFGFKMDTTHYGVPTIIKGDDSNGVSIQFYQDNGFYYQLLVTVNGKNVVDKKYPLDQNKNYVSDGAVKQIMSDLEKWKNHEFSKTRVVGE